MRKALAIAFLALSVSAHAQDGRKLSGTMPEQFTALVGSHVKLMGASVDDVKVESVAADQFCGHYYTPKLGGGPYAEGEAVCVPFASVERFEQRGPNLDRVYLRR
jgi:hypothetical protein